MAEKNTRLVRSWVIVVIVTIIISGLWIVCGEDNGSMASYAVGINASAVNVTRMDDAGTRSDCFSSIFAFGDSQTDTGNAVSAFPSRFSSPQAYPYGMSYFTSSPDRYCDGRLFIDFMAQAAGLSLVHPYLKGFGANFASGANFAVVGATAQNTSFITPFHIGVQVDWFRRFKSNVDTAVSSGVIMQGIRGDGYFQDGLYIINIGGNDIINALLGDRNSTRVLDNIRSQLPLIANRTLDVIQELYDEGARRFFIQNIPPTGCNPATLTMLSNPYTEYDMLGCIRPINNVIQSYGYILQDGINTLRRRNQDGLFIYGDYFGLVYSILERHSEFGFNQTTQNCCGVGGFYNFDMLIRCGQTGVLNGRTVEADPCDNPSTYIFWDGIHFTEAANRVIAQQFLDGFYVNPSNALRLLCDFDMSIIRK
ncbi:hypothetical protein KP509_29G039000 [Ceratopteris richardii]|uniref:Uncharacterized protein n=1 Tax=Ceratopteris richardii TaxID=49495 RepID=A0A8T2R7V3_CERRI|nr:hypothetical protein KP509_29G039000 [Ceratopteris richardii]